MWIFGMLIRNLIRITFVFAVVFTALDVIYGYDWFAWLPKMRDDGQTIVLLSMIIMFGALVSTIVEHSMSDK